MKRIAFAIVALCASVAACTGDNALGPGNAVPSAVVGPLCKAGCVEVDPNPALPGVFLSSAVTDANCFGTQYTDTDQDGLGDRCEYDIAAAFAPTMKYVQGDDVSRESYWAARPVGGTSVMVEYQLGYYYDLGTQENYTACKLFTVGELLTECDGHHGDSESITLTATYNESSQHWVLTQASLSRHKGYIVLSTGPNGYPSDLQYVNRVGADPIIWVANGKHANYPSQADCDDGGTRFFPIYLVFSFETCQGVHSTFRAEFGGQRNIGSDNIRLIDCVTSENPFYQSPTREECLWTGNRFYGWQLDHTTSSDPYSARLEHDGFLPL